MCLLHMHTFEPSASTVENDFSQQNTAGSRYNVCTFLYFNPLPVWGLNLSLSQIVANLHSLTTKMVVENL